MDNFLCQECKDSNQRKFLQVHHIVPAFEILKEVDLSLDFDQLIKYLKENTIYFLKENGITLCVQCHSNHHDDAKELILNSCDKTKKDQ